jgi:hypothetical protein
MAERVGKEFLRLATTAGSECCSLVLDTRTRDSKDQSYWRQQVLKSCACSTSRVFGGKPRHSRESVHPNVRHLQPTCSKQDFVKVYGPNGPQMTWAQRAAAGVPAAKFQAALAAKRSGR